MDLSSCCSRSLSASYPDADWFFFATEDTKVDFRRLQKVLEGYDPNKVTINTRSIDTDYLNPSPCSTHRITSWATPSRILGQPLSIITSSQRGRRLCNFPTSPRGSSSVHLHYESNLACLNEITINDNTHQRYRFKAASVSLLHFQGSQTLRTVHYGF